MWNIFEILKNHAFEILLGIAVLFLLTYWLFCVDKSGTGTWDSKFHFDDRKPGNHVRAAGESKGEAECRYVLETIFSQSFPKRRPKFLFNSETGSSMELDMYNKDLGIACEYNGKQHYVYTPYFHRGGEADFEAQVRRDDLKRKVCMKLGIFLIEVPHTVKIHDIRSYIINKLREKGLLRE